MNKTYIVFSVILISIPLLISTYSYFLFLPTYVKNVKSVESSYFKYVGLAYTISGNKSFAFFAVFIFVDREVGRIAVYKYEGGFVSYGVGSARLPGRLGELVCSGEVPGTLYKLLFPPGNTTVSEYLLVIRRSGWLGVPSPGLARPAGPLGFGRAYVGELFYKNGTLAAGLDSIPIQNILYTWDGKRFVAYGFRLADVAVAFLGECGVGRVSGFSLVLNETNFTPPEQPWGLVFLSNFNALFPMSYGLVFAGVVLWLYGWRRSR